MEARNIEDILPVYRSVGSGRFSAQQAYWGHEFLYTHAHGENDVPDSSSGDDGSDEEHASRAFPEGSEQEDPGTSLSAGADDSSDTNETAPGSVF